MDDMERRSVRRLRQQPHQTEDIDPGPSVTAAPSSAVVTLPEEVGEEPVATERDRWLAQRRRGLGGSDVAAVLGLNPWKSPLDVYLEKRGHVSDDFSSQAARWGNVLEPVIAEEYEDRERVSVYAPEPKLIVDEARPWLRGTPDRLVRGEDRGLEIKLVGPRQLDKWGEAETDQVPEMYLIQSAWYMALTRCQLWDVAALLGGTDLRIYRLERNPGLERVLLERAEQFWREHVEAGVAPSAQRGDERALAALFADPTSEVREAADDEVSELAELAEHHAELSETLRQLKEERDELELRFREVIQRSRGVSGRLPDGRRWRALWYPVRGSSYTVTRRPGRNFKLTISESR